MLPGTFLPPYMARASMPCSTEYAAILFPEASPESVGQFLLGECQLPPHFLDRFRKVLELTDYGHWTSPADWTRHNRPGATFHWWPSSVATLMVFLLRRSTMPSSIRPSGAWNPTRSPLVKLVISVVARAWDMSLSRSTISGSRCFSGC